MNAGDAFASYLHHRRTPVPPSRLPGAPISTADALAGFSGVQSAGIPPKATEAGSSILSTLLTAGLSAYCAYKGAEFGAKASRDATEKKIMESNRMKRTADAKSFSKKNLVHAYIELGRQFDEAGNVIEDLRVQLDASRSVAKIHGEEMAKFQKQASKVTRCQEEIRKLRALVAHYFEGTAE